jgi:hypothetical protein
LRSYHGQYRTAQPEALRHLRLRMTCIEQHDPRGAAGRGPTGTAGSAQATPELHCTVRSGTDGHGPKPDPVARAARGPRKLRVDTCTSRHRRQLDPLAASGPEALCDSELTYASMHAHLGTAGRGTRRGAVGRERAGGAA